jgi:hypothetical protein
MLAKAALISAMVMALSNLNLQSDDGSRAFKSLKVDSVFGTLAGLTSTATRAIVSSYSRFAVNRRRQN